MSNFSWSIEYQGKEIGFLGNPQYADNAASVFDITCLEGFEEIVFEPNNWIERKFVLRNLESQEVATKVWPHGFGLPLTKALERSQIILRFPITDVEFSRLCEDKTETD